MCLLSQVLSHLLFSFRRESCGVKLAFSLANPLCFWPLIFAGGCPCLPTVGLWPFSSLFPRTMLRGTSHLPALPSWAHVCQALPASLSPTFLRSGCAGGGSYWNRCPRACPVLRFCPKASWMLGFSFRILNRGVGASRSAGICGR